MLSFVIDMENGSEGFKTFLGASKRASQRGDYRQAERLLKTSLKQAEEHLFAVESAMKEMLESLLEVYKVEGKLEEAELIASRLAELERGTKRTS